MLPIFLQRAVCAITILAEIWVGSDKLLGGYRQKSCNLVVTAGASDSLFWATFRDGMLTCVVWVIRRRHEATGPCSVCHETALKPLSSV